MVILGWNGTGRGVRLIAHLHDAGAPISHHKKNAHILTPGRPFPQGQLALFPP
jgi:hypothetical protein